MSAWIIRYSAESKGLNLQEIKVSNDHPKVEEITINTDSECKRIIAEITLKDICTEKETIEIADEINILFDQIAIEYDVPIGSEERFFCKNKVKQTGNHAELEMLPIFSSGCGISVYTPSEDQLNILKGKIEKGMAERNIKFQLYRFCIGQKDMISRFMSLYHLLFVIVDDNQNEVDKVIEKYQPDVEKTVSPYKKNEKETIYTRLRNEIAHKREGCSPEKTKSEIDCEALGLIPRRLRLNSKAFFINQYPAPWGGVVNSCINKFQEIVRKAVLEKKHE